MARSQRHLYEVQGYTVIGSGTEPAYEEVTYPPTSAVIVALAEAFSAETTKRSRKKPVDDG